MSDAVGVWRITFAQLLNKDIIILSCFRLRRTGDRR